MAIHELTTNAAKHGALSTRDGALAIDWSIEREDEVDMLEIVWQESGGPPILDEPTRKGFGTTLLQRLLTMQIGGTVLSTLPRDGARVVIRAPMMDVSPSPMGDARAGL